MAKQKGHVKYVGTLGEVRHFKIKGRSEFFAGLKGGPTAEQVKTAPGFIRTRENMSEFTACANAGRSLRFGLSSVVKKMADSTLTGRLTGIMKKINIEDGSEARGQRAILVSTQTRYLKGLELNKNVSFKGIYNGPFELTSTPDRNESLLSVQPFNPLENMSIPSGATHFRFINLLSVLSNVVFNSGTGAYEPAAPDLNELSNVVYSDYIPVDAITPLIEINAALPNSPTITTDVAVLGSIGVEFFQEVNGTYNGFQIGNAMRIEKAF